MQGKVKFYKPKEGWGFITKEDSQGDIFFHVSGLVDRDHNLQQNDIVMFEVGEGLKGREKAIKVKRIER